MAVVLKADNRGLTENQKYSYTNDNYLSGVATVELANSAGFLANDYALFGEFGSETAEMVQVQTVTAATHTLTLTAVTKFAHSESTKVTVMPYNQVRFYHTATATFDSLDLLTTADVQPDGFYTSYSDSANSTGFGWFKFYNATSGALTSNSNAIPYANFTRDNVKNVLDNFYSMLNNNELRLVSEDDSFAWLNEAYSIARNELNLVNTEHAASDETSLAVVSGTKEYALPAAFSNMLSLYDGTDSVDVEFVALQNVPDWDSVAGNTPKYYLRGDYIGLSPTPTEDTTYTYRYVAKTTELNSYYDTISLPDNAVYTLKDHMMFRAAQKLGRPDAQTFWDTFQVGIDRLKISGVKRDSDRDTWGIERSASV